MTESDKKFSQCFYRESRHAYKAFLKYGFYVIVAALVLSIIFVLCKVALVIGESARPYVIQFSSAIGDVISSPLSWIGSVLSQVPLWLWLALGTLFSPAAYACLKCIARWRGFILSDWTVIFITITMLCAILVPLTLNGVWYLCGMLFTFLSAVSICIDSDRKIPPGAP
ncbi:MAG: hypothetical protein M0Q91_13765 [Methanoregula sp.]|nr:hypothetical protein [Methanoregula sp.]